MSATSAPSGFLTTAPMPTAVGPYEKVQADRRPPTRLSRQRREALQFNLILVATYPFFLAAAAVRRLRPAQSVPQAYAPQRRSLFIEAKAMAVSAIPFVFMG